jgi:hypothetical protein
MKRTIYFVCASMVFILSAAELALARGSGMPEPGTMALLAGLVGGGLVAYKMLRKRK